MSPPVCCEGCGKRGVQARRRHGRVLPWKELRALQVPADCPIPTCRFCGRTQLDGPAAELLRDRLETAYRQELRRRIRAAINELGGQTTFRSLERLLGLSQGYLSRLRAGAGNPSPALVAQLAMLAADPTQLQRLRAFWVDASGGL